MRSADSRERGTEVLGRSHAHETQLDRQRGRRRLEVLDRLRVVRRVRIPQDCDPVTRGIASLSSCSRLALSSAIMIESPVTFPPGCARFVTRPDPTGSATIAMTMGMVDVARLAARAATCTVRRRSHRLCAGPGRRPTRVPERNRRWRIATRSPHRVPRRSPRPAAPAGTPAPPCSRVRSSRGEPRCAAAMPAAAHRRALAGRERAEAGGQGSETTHGEQAPAHRITSSARSRIDSGIVMPSALAVLRLTTSSNLVGCSIGRSPGLAPFRILSTYPADRRNKSSTFGP